MQIEQFSYVETLIKNSILLKNGGDFKHVKSLKQKDYNIVWQMGEF